MKHIFLLKFRHLIAVILVLLISSCADDGPAGPAGPVGPVGAAGPPGATGSANVIYSDWFGPEAYTMSTVFGMKVFAHTTDVAEITQEIVDQGVVLVYGKLSGYVPSVWPDGQVGQLPISLTYNQGDIQSDTWSAYATVGKLRITFVNSVNFYNSIATQHQFRYVIIPGGVAVGGRVASLDVARLKSLSYGEAMAELGIPQ